MSYSPFMLVSIIRSNWPKIVPLTADMVRNPEYFSTFERMSGVMKLQSWRVSVQPMRVE